MGDDSWRSADTPKQVGEFFDFYAAQAIAASAATLLIPDLASEVWATPRRLAKLMSPSFRRRVQFIDRRKTLWGAVERYFDPFRTVGDDGKVEFAHYLQINVLGRALYQTVIALKFSCEVALPANTSHVATIC
jgi:hypothetical protein